METRHALILVFLLKNTADIIIDFGKVNRISQQGFVGLIQDQVFSSKSSFELQIDILEYNFFFFTSLQT